MSFGWTAKADNHCKMFFVLTFPNLLSFNAFAESAGLMLSVIK